MARPTARGWFEEFASRIRSPTIATTEPGLIAPSIRRGLAKSDVLCFLHNDTEMRDARWLERLLPLLPHRRIGLAGSMERALRRDGRYVGGPSSMP